MISKSEEKAVLAFYERVRSLLDEGYVSVFSALDEPLFFAKLRHENGNYVCVILNIHERKLSQLKNGKEVFSSKVC